MQKTIKINSMNLYYVSLICLMFVFLISDTPLFSSNLSKASSLRERCEKEIKILEVSVKNFGGKNELADFQKGSKLIKKGKVKFIQSKYPAAIDKYENYLKLQNNIYRKLSAIYIKRTEKIIDEAGEDLVDHIDNKKVEKYFRLASQNLHDAKSVLKTDHYRSSVNHCKTAKHYAISAYKIAGKKIPDKFSRDITDYKNRVHK